MEAEEADGRRWLVAVTDAALTGLHYSKNHRERTDKVNLTKGRSVHFGFFSPFSTPYRFPASNTRDATTPFVVVLLPPHLLLLLRLLLEK